MEVSMSRTATKDLKQLVREVKKQGHHAE